MKKFFVTGLLISTTHFLLAQKSIDAVINSKEVERIERPLASEEMRGRTVYSPEIDKAADFIAAEFKAAGLKTWNNSNSYRQEFSVVTTKLSNSSYVFDNSTVEEKNVVVLTTQPGLFINEKSGFEKVKIEPGKSLSSEARKLLKGKKNYLAIVDTSYSRSFSQLSRLKRQLFKSDYSVVFVLTSSDPKGYVVEARHEITEQKLSNVVGIIPAKGLPIGRAGKKNEYVVFSGHYDHLGVTTRPVNTDSIYNGANEDAAGTTAFIMLAKYFAQSKNNE